MKRNELEILQEQYPEVKQMTFNNHGWDYLVENNKGQPIRLEYKFRSNGVKFDITPRQEKDADMFTLRTEDDKHFHMSKQKYLILSKPHSALNSGWKGKSRELTQKKFIDNASKDLYEVVNSIKPDYGVLPI